MFIKFLNSMSHTSIRMVLFAVIWSSFSIFQAETANTFINFTTPYTLKNSTKQVAKKTVNSTQYVYFLFEDKTVGKYSNQLSVVSSFTLGNKGLSTLGVYWFNQTLEFYYGVVESGSNEIFVYMASNSTNTFSIKNFTNVKHVQMLKYLSQQIFDILVYREDILFRYCNTNSSAVVQNFTNLSLLTSARNYIQKVIRTDYNNFAYNVILTSLNHIYLAEFNATYESSPSLRGIDKKVDLSTIRNLTLMSSLVIDCKEIVIVQFNNSELYAFHMMNGTSVTIGTDVQALVGTGAVLKGLYPESTSYGERLLVFSSKSIRVNLTVSGYVAIAVQQENFAVTTWSDMMVLGSNSSFVFTTKDANIYFFDEAVVVTNATVNATVNATTNITIPSNQTNTSIDPSCTIPNCQTCISDFSSCLICLTGFQESNGTCLEVQNCSDANCQICDIFGECLICMTDYQIDLTSNECVLANSVVVDPLPTNQTTTNQSDSSTNDNTTVPLPQPVNITTPNTTVNQSEPLDNSTTINDTTTTNPVLPDSQNTTTIDQNTTNIDQNTTVIDQVDPTPTEIDSFTQQRIDNTFNSFSPQMKNLNQISSNLNSLPGARIFLTFVNPFFGFFDDYWYYIYHQDSYPQLEILPQFLVFMYLINNERIFPDYLELDHPFRIDAFKSSNYSAYTHPQIEEIDKQETYFVANLQQMLFEQYLVMAFIFVVIKFIVLVLKYSLNKTKLKKMTKQKKKATEESHEAWHHSLFVPKRRAKFSKEPTELPQQQSQPQPLQPSTPTPPTPNPHPILQALTNYMESLISFKSILITLIGSNIIFITFNFSTQLRIMFSMNGADRGNIVSTIVGGFLLIAFTFTIFLYEELWSETEGEEAHEKRGNHRSSQIITDEKRQCLQMTYFRHLKSLMYGFVHGFFIYEPLIQYSLLISIKIYFMAVTLREKTIIRNNLMRCIIFTYFFTGMWMDLLCLFSKMLFIPKGFLTNIVNDYNLVNILELVCISIITLTLILQIAIEIYFDFRNTFCHPQKHTEHGVESQRPKTILMLLRRIVPENIFEQSKASTQNREDFDPQNHQSFCTFSPKSLLNSSKGMSTRLENHFKIKEKSTNNTTCMVNHTAKNKIKRKLNRLTAQSPMTNDVLKVVFNQTANFSRFHEGSDQIQHQKEMHEADNATALKQQIKRDNQRYSRTEKGHSHHDPVLDHGDSISSISCNEEEDSNNEHHESLQSMKSPNAKHRHQRSPFDSVQLSVSEAGFIQQTMKPTMGQRYKLRRRLIKNTEHMTKAVRIIEDDENIV